MSGLKRVKQLVLRCGYVESSSTGCLVFCNGKAFNSVEEAMKSLAKALREVQESEYAERSSHLSRKKCPHCGKLIEREESPTPQDFLDWIDTLGELSANDTGGNMYEILEKSGWEETFVLNALTAYVYKNAEKLLTQFAFPDHEDLDEELDLPDHVEVPDGMKIVAQDQ